jgi:hypothetical protein
MNRKDLIARGYFPKELPPPFTTSSLANYATTLKASLSPFPKGTAKLYSHNHVRYGTLRRKLSIPNPAFFLQLSSAIEDGWSDIQSIIQKSRFSKSKPTYTSVPSRNRSISPFLDFSLLPLERAKNRISGRYILQADISLFYQSIYTHSIPWAIHGKDIAKKQRNDISLLGNKLDKLLRNSQDGQTLGIPIGPDTSLVIAELILCTSDIELEKRLKNSCIHPFKGFRYSDDYEFAFLTLSDAETAMSQIQQTLSYYELTINPNKTRISEIPCPLDSPWVLSLSNYKFNDNQLAQMQDIIRYFDRAFELTADFPEEPVLKYAIVRVGQINNLQKQNWSLLESLLLQSITIDPSTLLDSLAIIQQKLNDKYTINSQSLEEVINYQILRHAPLGHSSEVAWSIWSAMVFNLPISKSTAASLSKMEDSAVALLALDAQRKGQIKEGLDTTKWERFLTEDELYGEQWLLSYEANRQGYLSTTGGADYVTKDSWFSQLKANGVTFYNQSAPLLIPPSEPSGPSGQV